MPEAARPSRWDRRRWRTALIPDRLITRRATLVAAAAAVAGRPALAAQGGFAACTSLAGIAAGLEHAPPGAWPASRVHYLLASSVTGLRLVYVNWYVSGGREVAAPTPMKLRAAAELPSGEIVPVRFDSAPEIVVPPGGTVVSDALPATLARGVTLGIRTAVSSEDGSWPSTIGIAGGPLHDGFTLAAAAGAELAAFPNAGRTVPGYGPSAILGQGAHPACAIVGDSGAAGAGDRSGDAHGSRGFIERSLAGLIGTVNLSRSSELASDFAAGAPRRLALLRQAGCDRAVVLYGSNDIAGNHGLDQVKASLHAVWQALATAGVRTIVQCTIFPKINQPGSGPVHAMPGYEAQGSARTALNAWLRTRPAPLTAVADITPAIEENGLWRTPDGDVLTDDGTHPNSAGAALIARHAGLAALLGAPGY